MKRGENTENEVTNHELSELMRAIILRAIEDLRQGGEIAEDARRFFMDYNLDDDHPFSFRSICNYLGLNAELTRDKIFETLENNYRISTRRRHI